jgi:SAM-dependent methyltransferase
MAGKQVMKHLFSWLLLPANQCVENIDDLSATLLHAEIIQQKKFLRGLYSDFYHELKRYLKNLDNGTIVELGSGSGFIKDVIPSVITSEILELPSVDMIFSAMEMPFVDASVDAIVMVDVLHHIPDVRAFFREARRCLVKGGRIVMIEPGNTAWGRFVYQNFHHETFDPKAGWVFESKGPLSTANGAIPWIVFHRDRAMFLEQYPDFKIVKTQFHAPFRYLLSGGFTLRQLMPSWSYGMVKALERLLTPLNRWIGMFETIVIEKAT